jgi:radical SAM protein with 4Fe4S-binding SPASM domain
VDGVNAKGEALDILRRIVRRSTRFPGFRLRTGRRFLTVRMDTTNRCNLRCRMCPMRLADRDPDRVWTDMDPALFARVADQVFPLARRVGLSCGAEPFCNPAFEDYLAGLHRADVPIREVVTNGTLMGEGEVGALLRYPPTSLTVSIDGASPETHAAIRGGADLGAVLDAVGRLVDRRKGRFPMVSFSMTLQRSNLDELQGVLGLAADAGAVSVGVVPLVPYEGLGMAGQALDMRSPAARRVLAEARRTAAELGVELTEPGDDGSAEGCPYVRDWVYIDPDGLVNPCPYWDTSKPLGDLSRQDFGDVWRGRAYTELRRRLAMGELSGNCADCPVSSAAGGEIPKV